MIRYRLNVLSADSVCSISSSVLKGPMLARRLPWGKLPTVRWASGAQWSPARIQIPYSRSSRKAAWAQSIPRRLKDTTAVCRRASPAP